MNMSSEKKRIAAALACTGSCLGAGVIPFVMHTGVNEVVKGIMVGATVGVSVLGVVWMVKSYQADQA